MSVENQARAHGPSKVSRRNLIAGAAVAVPTAAVLNASSAWAKPVVTSLIGMPALVASQTYNFGDLFGASVGTHSTPKKTFSVPFTLTNKSGETLAVSVVASATKPDTNPLKVTVSNGSFSLNTTSPQVLTLTVGWASTPNPDLPSGVYTISLAITAKGGGVTKNVSYSFTVTI
jgi:hypothetical protein